jgi:hypothetical protein
MNERDWIDILQALLTPTIAVFVTYLAWRQYQIQRQRVRMDLFEKRFHIFNSALNHMGHTFAISHFDEEAYRKFLKDIQGAQFLFSKEIDIYLKSIRNATLDMDVEDTYVREEVFPNGDRKKVIQRKLEKLRWISEQIEEIEGKFRPYMQIEQQSWLRRPFDKPTPSSK